MDYLMYALELILSVFPVVWNWFTSILAASGSGLQLWTMAVFAVLSFRFIIAPIFGWAAGSDKAEAARAAKEKRDAEYQARMGYYRSGKEYYDSRKR